MGHVFISYKHEDGDFAELLIGRIEKAGFESWSDNDRLHAGEDWRAEIDQAIKCAFALIVIMSPEARASEYVTYEWAFAWGIGIKVIPVLYKSTKLHPRLEALQYLDFTSRTARPWDALIEAIKIAARLHLPSSTSASSSLPSYLRQALEDLDSANADDRKNAIERLAQLDDPIAQEALIQALQHPLQDVRINAAFIRIGHNDQRALPGVIEALEVDNFLVRHKANDILKEIANKESVPFLIETLSNKKRKDLARVQVITMLGRIGDTSVVPSIIEALRDKSYDVRCSALRALGEIGDTSAISALGEALLSESDHYRHEALEAIVKIGDATAIPYLLEALRRDESIKDYTHINSALRQIGNRLRKNGDSTAIPGLLEALRDRKSFVRSGAAETLGEIRNKVVTADLLETLNDEEDSVRRSVIDALGKINDASAVPHLLKALHDKDKRTRWSTAEALGKIGDARAIPGLLETLIDNDVLVRRRTAEALGKIGDARAIPGLLEALYDNDDLVRSRAVDALNEIGDITAIPSLLISLGDEKELVRRSAIKALGRFGSDAIPGLIEALHDKKEFVREAATEGLLLIGEPTIPALVEVIQDEKEYARFLAARILRQICSPEVYKTIITSYENEQANNLYKNEL